MALVGASPVPDGNTQNDQVARNRSVSEQIPPANPKQVAGPRPDTGCERGKDQRQSDLCAQWKAADAAHDAALSAKAQTIIGYVGLLLGAITMFAAIAAALYARRAAVATEETVGIARDAAKGADAALAIAERNATAAAEQVAVSRETSAAQLRAWIVFDSVVATEVNENGQTFFDVAVQWKNVGKTPSRNSNIGITWKTFAPGAPVQGHKKPRKFPDSVAGVLGPGLAVWSPVFRLTLAQFFNQRMSIISRCTYEDVFSRRKRVSETHIEVVVIRASGNQYAPRWTVIGETIAT